MPVPRRRLLESLAALPLLPSTLAPAEKPPQPIPAATPTPAPGEVKPGPVAETLAEVVRHRWGSHFGPEDLEEIRKGIEGNLRAAERLRAVKLRNADEPVTAFAALPPGRGAKR
jgi:hypothetical protein